MHPAIAALAMHSLAAAFLVGGLFFAVAILSPSAQSLERTASLAIWRDALARFLVRGWIGLALLLTSGVVMVQLVYGRPAFVPAFVRVMMALGAALAVTFAYLQFVPWRRFRDAVAASEWPAAQQQINAIRRTLMFLLFIGILTIVVGSGGRYLS